MRIRKKMNYPISISRVAGLDRNLSDTNRYFSNKLLQEMTPIVVS